MTDSLTSSVAGQKARRQHTKEYKQKAIALARDPEVGFRRAAKDLGLNESLLRKWADLMMANAETFGVSNVKPISGTAPEVFASLPAPDAIFVGGNGGEVARLLEAGFAALRPGGRLVTNVGTVEMLTATYAVLKRLGRGVEVLLINLSRGVEQLESLRFEAVNPTFLLRVHKPDPDWVV